MKNFTFKWGRRMKQVEESSHQEGLQSLKRIVKCIAVADVLLALIMIILYVYFMAEHRHEFELVRGSKREQLILYCFVSLTTAVEIFVAFRYYHVLSNSRDDDNVDILWMSKCWMIISYVLLINWITKAGTYARQRTMSIALVLCLLEVVFRISGVYFVKKYIYRIEIVEKEKRVASSLRQEVC